MEFCNLCMRKYIPPAVNGWTDSKHRSDTSGYVDNVENILHFRPEAANVTVCRTCWILVQLNEGFGKNYRTLTKLEQQLTNFGPNNDMQRNDSEESLEDENSISELEGASSDSTVTAAETCWKCFRTVGYPKEHAQFCDVFSSAGPKRNFYTCSICSAEFILHSHLEVHLNKHKKIKPFKCRQRCDSYFYGRVGRIKHERTCKHAIWSCFYCDDQLESARAFTEHLAKEHDVRTFME